MSDLPGVHLLVVPAIDGGTLVSLIPAPRLRSHVGEALTHIPSFDFDHGNRITGILTSDCGGYLSGFPWQQREMVILPQPGQDFVVARRFPADTEVCWAVQFQVNGKHQRGVGLCSRTVIVPSSPPCLYCAVAPKSTRGSLLSAV